MELGRTLFFILAALGTASGAAEADAWAPEPAPAEQTAGPETRRDIVEDVDIIVTGQRLRGSAIGNVRPELRLDAGDVAAYGAATIGDLVEQLRPQTRSAAGGASDIALVLVNGQRLSSFAEIRNFPPEAILRVDILPEQVARRYGASTGSKVVNIVLRPDFRSVTANASHGFATEGGRSFQQLDFNLARITPAGRWNLGASYRRSAALAEDERDIDGGFGRFRTLLPRGRQVSVSGSFARDLSPTVSASLTARLDANHGESRVGPAASSGHSPPRPILRQSRSRSASFGGSIGGGAGQWQWSLTGNVGFSRDLIETRVHGQRPDVSREPDRIRSRQTTADAQWFAYGPLATLPAGELTASLLTRFDIQRYRSRLIGAGPDIDLTRRSVSTQASFEIPLANRGGDGLGAVGGLSATLDLEAARISGFGTVAGFGAGLRWEPARWVTVSAGLEDKEGAPDIQALAEPPIATPDVRIFDYATGETVDVTRLEGGNPSLAADRRRVLSLGLAVRPIRDRNLSITVNYARRRTRNPIGSLALSLPEIEAAFPERFTRDAAGRLIRIDARPVNFARSEREELRWGVTFIKALPARGPPPPSSAASGIDLKRLTGSGEQRGGRLQLAFYHSWHLRDELLIREGGPKLDFLNGAPVGSLGGRSRHELEAQAGYYRDGLGARLGATWQSGTKVRTGAGDILSFSSRTRVEARLFADLGEQSRLVRRASWLKGARLSLEIDNLFDNRPRVRDRDGLTPRGLQSAYLEPLGRTVRISFRKLF